MLAIFATLIVAVFVLCVLILGDVFFLFEDSSQIESKTLHRRLDHREVAPFLHLSDIHLSKYDPGNSELGLRTFVKNFLPVIAPSFVVVTGDLTDAKDVNHYLSIQHVEEWQSMDSIIQEANETWGGVWLDLRGNHDAFDVAKRNGDSDYFAKHSSSAKNERIEMVEDGVHLHFEPQSKSCIVTIDATPTPGPKRPYNFFGTLSVKAVAQIEDHLRKARSLCGENVIVGGHYPLALVASREKERLAQAMRGTVHLSGHLHTLIGFAPQFYARRNHGILELELGDFKDNRMFRVAAYDGGVFSFADMSTKKMEKMRGMLVTWPPDARFIPRHTQNVIETGNQIFVRCFVYVDGEDLTEVSVSATFEINGKIHGPSILVLVDAKRKVFEGHVQLGDGATEGVTGTLNVVVTRKAGGETITEISRPVSLNGHGPLPLPIFPSFLIKVADYRTLAISLIWIASIFLTLPVWFGTLIRLSVERSRWRMWVTKMSKVSDREREKEPRWRRYAERFVGRCLQLTERRRVCLLLLLPYVWILLGLPILIGNFLSPGHFAMVNIYSTDLYLGPNSVSNETGDGPVLVALPRIVFAFLPATIALLVSPLALKKNRKPVWVYVMLFISCVQTISSIRSHVPFYGDISLLSPIGLFSLALPLLSLVFK